MAIPDDDMTEDDEGSYTNNVLAALALAISDRLSDNTAEAAKHGPSAPAILTTLRFTPGLPIERLAQTVGMTVPGAVQLLNRLEADGLVERIPGSDRRRRHPQLTAAGKRVAAKVLSARALVVEHALATIGASDRAVLTGIVERMLTQLSGTRDLADRICRLCDERSCPDERCPSEAALPPELRAGTLCP
ncbi:MarR family transcriptional regulator [Mycolicibacterium sp. CH28]|uniref:MarR family winged helix-turn-helix transcriptional regulator n=1 Tax=Mycolicibacterium sp. CH28 TaxID=2512237 RepID=UPI0010805991|nr:MarR family transcriptional regulator [Mycolicibacterium sp. CH28]TGD89737.1 MarR family transcriptional regulator [Mycolicibacterium sp. CH28]